MPHIKTEIIITKSVLNNKTGEIRDEEFIQKKSIMESCKGGWRMVYSDFDYLLLNMKSPNEIKILLQIRDLFKASLSRVVINKTNMSKKIGTTRATLSKFITRLIQYDFLMELEDKQYMMNPFMCIPYKSSAKELQNEWIKIRRDSLYNRRGLSNNEYRIISEGKMELKFIKGILIDKNREIKGKKEKRGQNTFVIL